MISIFPGSNEKNQKIGPTRRVILARDPAGRLMFFSFKLLNPGLMKPCKKNGSKLFFEDDQATGIEIKKDPLYNSKM